MLQEESPEMGEGLWREGNLDLAGAKTAHRQDLTKVLLVQTLQR
jgi:hypothetical protein